jgi:hypothetical protein
VKLSGQQQHDHDLSSETRAGPQSRLQGFQDGAQADEGIIWPSWGCLAFTVQQNWPGGGGVGVSDEVPYDLKPDLAWQVKVRESLLSIILVEMASLGKLCNEQGQSMFEPARRPGHGTNDRSSVLPRRPVPRKVNGAIESWKGVNILVCLCSDGGLGFFFHKSCFACIPLYG